MELTPQQHDAIHTRARRICVAAGAGSGKTFVLVQRIIALLREGADLDGIVAITFTEKAAAEMKARLRREFRKLALGAADATEMTFWRDLERRLDGARISTIHAFCMRLLKENAVYLQLDPDFSLLTEAQSRLLSQQVARDTLLELLRQEHAPLMHLAGVWPFHRLQEMMVDLLPQAQRLATAIADWPLNDPAALAALWRERAKAVLAEELQSHAMRRRLRQLKARLEAFEGRCANPEEGREQRRRFLIQTIDELLEHPESAPALTQRVVTYAAKRGTKKDWESEASYEELSALQDKVTKLFKEDLDLPTIDDDAEAEAAAITASLLQVCRILWERMAEAKRQAQTLNFDDLIVMTAQALRDDEALRLRAASGVAHLLMDEFQDTDPMQLLIADALCSVPEGPTLFVVGDAKQSIYKFRGADVAVFTSVRESADSVLPLAKNFRSVDAILNFVNALFVASDLLGAVESTFGSLEPHRVSEVAPCVELLVGTRDSEEKVKAKESRELEAALIAARILELCAGPPIIHDERDDCLRPPRPGDFAILLRAMSNVHLYEEALRQSGIEYGVVAGAGFFQRQEVLDILNLLKALLDPWDEPALLAFLRGPFCALRDDTLALLCEHETLTRAFLSDALPSDALDADALTDARALWQDLRAQAGLPIDAFLDYLLRRTHFEAVQLALPSGIQRASNVRKLVDVAHEFAAGGEQSMRVFARYLGDVQSASVREGDALLQPQEGGAVTIITLHSSKGLEFPIVILADASGKLNAGKNRSPVSTHPSLGVVLAAAGPSGESRGALWRTLLHRRAQREDQDEHARLLYVALTRARDRLIISGSPEPEENTWLHAVDTVYHALDKAHGHVFSGEGWSAVVNRQAVGTSLLAHADVATTDWDAVFVAAQQPLPKAPPSATITVSELLNRLAQENEEVEVRLDADEPPASYPLLRGALIHRLFELWDFRVDPPDITALAHGAPLFPEQRLQFLDSAADIIGGFQQLPLFEELRCAEFILREHPFVLRLGDTFLRGTIDCIVDDHTIVDYKTGEPHPEREARYQWQLRLYAVAMRELTGRLPLRGLIVYVDKGLTSEVTFDEASTSEALEHIRALLS